MTLALLALPAWSQPPVPAIPIQSTGNVTVDDIEVRVDGNVVGIASPQEGEPPEAMDSWFERNDRPWAQDESQTCAHFRFLGEQPAGEAR